MEKPGKSQSGELSQGTAGKIRLSILICHLESRKRQLGQLLEVLRPQIDNVTSKYWIAVDYGTESIGAKRNTLLRLAQGDYVCFIDDDDLVADFYIEEILKAIESEPDCVGFNGALVHKNGREEPVTYRMGNTTIDRKGAITICGIGHLNPVKREIALSVKFPEKSSGEDYEYAMALQSKLTSEVFIDQTIYYYLQGNKNGSVG